MRVCVCVCVHVGGGDLSINWLPIGANHHCKLGGPYGEKMIGKGDHPYMYSTSP